MKLFKKTKAFTLTELLVVVIVLGVLAAVAVPKFSRVLETRRTTEAENMLSAVRMEQEKRCSLGKNYTGDFGKMSTVAYAQTSYSQGETTNYTYTLTSTGVEAARRAQDYILKIPSYQTGEICCEGEYCNSLNKNYPSCTDLSLPAEDECSSSDVVPVVPPDPCEINPNTCECSTYAESHPCECDASYAENHPCQCDASYAEDNPCECDSSYSSANPCECDPDGDACQSLSPCEREDTKNTCECEDYAKYHKCECSPSAKNCCTYYDIPEIMIYNPQTGKCSCPSGSTLKDYGDYAECLCGSGSETGSEYCCEDRGYSWQNGVCKSECNKAKFGNPSFVSYGGNNSSSGSNGFYTMGGNYACDEYPSSSGGGQTWAQLRSSYSVCTDEGSFSGFPVSGERAGLTCSNYAGSKTRDFSCAYRVTYYGTNYSDCAMGVMSCKVESVTTWYCPIGKCSYKENKCL